MARLLPNFEISGSGLLSRLTLVAIILYQDDLKITEGDLATTPPAVLDSVRILAAENATLRKRIEELEAKLGEDSSNSNKPLSSDSPYDENEERQGW